MHSVGLLFILWLTGTSAQASNLEQGLYDYRLVQTIDSEPSSIGQVTPSQLIDAVGASRANLGGVFGVCRLFQDEEGELWRLQMDKTDSLYVLENGHSLWRLFHPKKSNASALNRIKLLGWVLQLPASKKPIEVSTNTPFGNLVLNLVSSVPATFSLKKGIPAPTFIAETMDGQIEREGTGKIKNVSYFTDWRLEPRTGQAGGLRGQLQVSLQRKKILEECAAVQEVRFKDLSERLQLVEIDWVLKGQTTSQHLAGNKERRADPAAVRGSFRKALIEKDHDRLIKSAQVLLLDEAPKSQRAIAKALLTEGLPDEVIQRIVRLFFVVTHGDAKTVSILLKVFHQESRSLLTRDAVLLAAAGLAGVTHHEPSIQEVEATLKRLAEKCVAEPNNPLAQTCLAAAKNLGNDRGLAAIKLLAPQKHLLRF